MSGEDLVKVFCVALVACVLGNLLFWVVVAESVKWTVFR